MEEGWNLINALGKGRLAVLPNGPRDMETLLKLDAWENQWFPISQAALDRRFPAVSARFFLNLKQTEGPGVAITVRTFVDRYDELAGRAEKFGAEAPQALALLAQRGVTEAVVTEAKDLSLGLAIAVTLFFNADTVYVAQRLWADGALRDVGVAAAEAHRAAPAAWIESTGLPVGWAPSPARGGGGAVKQLEIVALVAGGRADFCWVPLEPDGEVALSAPSSFCLYPRGARSGRS